MKCMLPLLGLMMLLYCSCETMLTGNGTVYSDETGQPLDSALVQAFVSKVNPDVMAETYTDSTGSFSVRAGMVGCTPRCPDLVVRIAKPTYVAQTVTNPVKAAVYLQKE